MSNLLKSKFLLGVMVVVAMFAVVGVSAPKTDAATCTITTTLRVGSKGAQVQCLQAALGLTADGSFGPKTKAAVIAFQAAHGLSADGVFGAMSRAAWANASAGMTLPAGCTSTAGFSPTTGASCSTGTVMSTLPAGCTSTAGFSSTTGMSCSTGGTVVTSGSVSAMLSSDNPASGYIIDNQATADLAHFTFTGTGSVTSVSLHRTGISNQNTLDNVYLFQGNTRITDGFSFNNNGDLTMNGLNIAVNGSTTISVKADVDSAAAATASTLGVNLSGFTANGTAVVSNLMGNQMYLGTGSPASVYLNSTSETVASPTVNAGTTAFTVWSSPIQVNTRAVWLKGANFRLTGSAPANAIANVHLFVDGVDAGSIATMTMINGSNYATFDFTANPVNLTTGSHTIDLRADIVSGASYNLTVSIQQAADLVIFDPQVGVNVAVTKNGTPGVGFSASTTGVITINAGSASVVVDPTFQAMTNITGGATNAVIGRFLVHGYGEDVKITSLDVLPKVANGVATNCITDGAGAPTGTCGLNNLTIYFNGSQVGSSFNWTSGSGAHTFQLGSQMIIPAGTNSTIEVRADLQTTGNQNYTAGTVSAQLNATATGQGQTSHSTVTFPGANTLGTSLTIQTGLLTVSKNSGYANQNANPNTPGTKIGSFTLQNQSSSEAVRVTSLTVGLTTTGGVALTNTAGGGAPALTNFSNLRTSETSGSGATPIQPSASNTFSVNFTLAPGATKTIDILADTSADATNAFATTLGVTAIGASSNVSIQQNGNGTAVAGQIITLATGTITNPPTLLSANSTSQQFVPASGGTTNATKATFKLAATNGAATISEMKFTVNSQDFSSVGTYGATSTGTGKVFTPMTPADAARFAIGDVVQIPGTTSFGVGTVTATSGTTVTVYITVAPVGGAFTVLRLVPNTVTGITVNGITAPVSNGLAYLTGLNLVVPNGGSGLTQDVFISYAPVGTNGVNSGSTSRVALESVKYTSGGTTTTLCTATIAACTPTLAAGGVAAPLMKLVGSSPTLSVASSSSILVAGTTDVGSVTVTANAKGDITLNALPINVVQSAGTTQPNAAPGYAANGVIVKDETGNTIATQNTAFDGTTAGGNSTITFINGGYPLSAGTSKTFHIFLTFNGVTNPNGAHTSSATFTLGSADAFSWTDTAGNASAATGVDVTGSAVTTVSNKFKDGPGASVTPGFLYNYPTNSVSTTS